MGVFVQSTTWWFNSVRTQGRRVATAIQSAGGPARGLLGGPGGSRRVVGAASAAILSAALIGSGAASASYSFVAVNAIVPTCDPALGALGGATPPIGIG